MPSPPARALPSFALLVAGGLAALGCTGLPGSTNIAAEPPRIEVMAELSGSDAETAEALLAIPLESALVDIPGAVGVDSESWAGAVRLTLRLAPGTDAWAAASKASERLTVLPELPPGVRPAMLVHEAEDNELVVLEGASLADLSAEAEALRKALLALPGVARATLRGQAEPRVDVRVDGPKLLALGLSPEALRGALSPDLLSGGPLLRVEAPMGIEAFTTLSVGDGGLMVRDVATVQLGQALPTGRVLASGGPAVGVAFAVRRRAPPDEAALASVLAAFVHVRPQAADVETWEVLAPGSAEEAWAAATTLAFGQGASTALLLEPLVPGEPIELRMVGAPTATPPPGVQLRRQAEAPLRVVLRGPDRAVLAGVAEAAMTTLRADASVRSLSLRPPAGGVPDLAVTPDREALARLGVSPREFSDGLRMLEGEVLLGTGGPPVELRVEGFGSTAALGDAQLLLPVGDTLRAVPLTEVARLELREVPRLLLRRDQGSAVEVQLDLADAEPALLARRRVAKLLAELPLPVGVTLEVVGD